MNDTLRKFICPEVVFGEGARNLAGKYIGMFGGRNVLLVSDEGVAAAGWMEEVRRSLASEGITTVPFTGISANPRDAEVAAGAGAFIDGGCDAIVVVGGGSPIDCAKAIGILAMNGGVIGRYEGVDRVEVPMPPIVCVPTTGGSGADVSQFAIINDVATRRKMAIISKALVPDVTLIDPDTSATLESSVAGYTGLDALVHAIEAFVSNASSPLTDVHALEAVRLISRWLVPAVTENSPEARRNMMLGSMHAGFAFSNASLGAVHALSHALGGHLDLPHGECNALLLEHVVAANFTAAPDRYRQIASILFETWPASGPTMKEQLVSALKAFREAAGISGSLAERGIDRPATSRLAEVAENDPCLLTNPRPLSVHDLEEIYVASL